MGSDEVLDFSIKHEGDAFWRRHCPVAYAPIDEHDQVDLARAAGKVQGAHSGLALSSLLKDINRAQRAAQPASRCADHVKTLRL